MVNGRIIAILIHYRKNDTRSSPQPYQSLSSTRSRGTASSSQIPAGTTSSIANPKMMMQLITFKYSSSITNPDSTILVETLRSTFLSFKICSSCSRLYTVQVVQLHNSNNNIPNQIFPTIVPLSWLQALYY